MSVIYRDRRAFIVIVMVKTKMGIIDPRFERCAQQPAHILFMYISRYLLTSDTLKDGQANTKRIKVIFSFTYNVSSDQLG